MSKTDKTRPYKVRREDHLERWGLVPQVRESYPKSKRDRQMVERQVRSAVRQQIKRLLWGKPEPYCGMLALRHPRDFISVR